METARNGTNIQSGNAPREKKMTIRLKRKQELRLIINDAPSFRLLENALRAVHDCQTGCCLLREEDHRKHLKVNGRIQEKIEEKVVLVGSDERTPNRLPLARHTTANTPVVSAFQSRINFYKTRNQTASRERSRDTSNQALNATQQQQQQYFYDQPEQLKSDCQQYVPEVKLKERVIGMQHLVIKKNSSVSRDTRQEQTDEEYTNSMRQLYSGYESNSPSKQTQTAQTILNPCAFQQKLQLSTQNMESHSKRLARIHLRGLLVESESPKQSMLLSQQNSDQQAQKQLFNLTESKQPEDNSHNIPCNNVSLQIQQASSSSSTQQASSKNPRYKARTSISIDTGNNNNNANIENTTQQTSSILASVNGASSGRRNTNRFRRPQGVSIDGGTYRQRYEHALLLPQTPDMSTNISLNHQQLSTPRCSSLHAHSRKFKPSKTSSRISFSVEQDSQNAGVKIDQHEENNKVASLLDEILQDRQKNKINQEVNDRDSQGNKGIDNAGLGLPPKAVILRKKETSRRRINSQLQINLESYGNETQQDANRKEGNEDNCNRGLTSDGQERRQIFESLHPNNRYNGFQEQEADGEGINMMMNEKNNEDHHDDDDDNNGGSSHDESVNHKRQTLEASWSLQNVKLDLDSKTTSSPGKQLPCLLLQENNNTDYKLHFIHHNHHMHGQNVGQSDQNQILKNYPLMEEEKLKENNLFEQGEQEHRKEEVEELIKVIQTDEQNGSKCNMDNSMRMKLTQSKEEMSEFKEKIGQNQIKLGNSCSKEKDSKRKYIGEEESSTQSLLSVRNVDNLFKHLPSQEEVDQLKKQDSKISVNNKHISEKQGNLNRDTKQALLDELLKDKNQKKGQELQDNSRNQTNTLQHQISNEKGNDNKQQILEEKHEYPEKLNEEGAADTNDCGDAYKDDEDVVQNSFDESDRNDSQCSSSRIKENQQILVGEKNQSSQLNQQPLLSVEQCDQLLQILNLVQGKENDSSSCQQDDDMKDLKKQQEVEGGDLQEQNNQEDEEDDDGDCQENEEEDYGDDSWHTQGDQIQSEGDQIQVSTETNNNEKDQNTKEMLISGPNLQKPSSQQDNGCFESSNKSKRLPSKRQRDVFNEEFWDPVRFPKNFKVQYIPPDLNKMPPAQKTSVKEISSHCGAAVKEKITNGITNTTAINTENKKNTKITLKSNNQHKTHKAKKYPNSDGLQQGQTALKQDLTSQADWNQQTSIFDELKEGFPLVSSLEKYTKQQPQEVTTSNQSQNCKEHSEIDRQNSIIGQVAVEQDYEDWDAELTAV